jgi:transcriptional regulator with XRE-family HTH domain
MMAQVVNDALSLGRALLAYNVRLNRVAKGLSQEALAIEAAIDKKHLCALELERLAVSVDVIDRLAKALGLPIAALFQPVEGDEPAPKMKGGRRPRR